MIGFSIPVLMILFVAASIYLPGIFQQPRYNFLYSADADYYDNRTYSVSNGRLIINPQPFTYPSNRPYQSPQLYVHNVTTNESTSVSFQEASGLTLDPSAQSPDGYKIENGSNNSGFFPFFWYDRDYNAQYIVGHNTSKKLNVKTYGSSYYNSIHFLGWITQ